MSSNAPCAACKFQRRKCTQECIFAPYFPPEDPQKFVNVHKVFGSSNVSKILSDIPTAQREDAVKSLAYEAQARLHEPIYGCVGTISYLQEKLEQIHVELDNAKKKLATYIGPNVMLNTYPQQAYGQMVYAHPQQQMVSNPSAASTALPYTNLMGTPNVYGAGTSQQLGIHDQQQQPQTALPYTSLMPQQHEVDTQRYGALATAEENELIQSYEIQLQHQQDYMLFKNSGPQYENGGGQMVGSGFIQMAAEENGAGPSLSMGVNYENPFSQIQQHDNVHHALQAQLVLQTQQQLPEQVLHTQLHHQNPQHKAENDEGRSLADPSC